MSENKRTIIVKNLFVLLMVLMLLTIIFVRTLTKPPESAVAGEGQIITHSQSTDNNRNTRPDVTSQLPRSQDTKVGQLTEDSAGAKGKILRQFDAEASAEENKNFAKKIESLLTLNVIVEGNNPQAFINDNLYKAGDKIDISDGNKIYDCVIESISQTEVLIDCEGIRIKLELANQAEVIEQ